VRRPNSWSSGDDPRYFRPAGVETLLGDPSNARAKLCCEPKTKFADLLREIIRDDLKEAERDALCSREGHRVLDRDK
jgi:GDPmannose 4,6-dehydratase